MKVMEHQEDNTNRHSTFANEETLETKDKSLKNRKNQSLTRRIKDKLVKGQKKNPVSENSEYLIAKRNLRNNKSD